MALSLAAHRPPPAIEHRLALYPERRRRVDRRGQDVLQGRRQHRLADRRPAAPYLSQGGFSAGGGVGALDSEEVGGGRQIATIS